MSDSLGETNDEFEKTLEYLKEIKFFKMHIFKYSKRNGTPAAVMKEQIDSKIKEERSKCLIELSNKNNQEILKKYIGNTKTVLIEEEKDGFWIGHTKNYMMVRIKSEKNLKNLILNVKIKSCENANLVGCEEL